jgi:murein DD-endopeptidase MepM/ murein hydrolase activator NlpD
MKRFRRRNAKRGEIIAMTLTSVLVLSVLTVTGLYIKNRNTVEEQDGYYIDFDALEAEMNNKIEQAENSDDLDYTGTQEEFDYTQQDTEVVQSDSIKKEDVHENQEEVEALEEVVVVPEETEPTTSEDIIEEQIVTDMPTLSFSEDETLVWPVLGEVLINFSMEKSVYFATLDQYKYSPAMVVEATEGGQVVAATEAVVAEVYKDNEVGNVVKMDLGDGYTLMYGQLQDVSVTPGQYVTTGQLIGTAGAPTRYYSVEGCNVYVKLTKNGEPINPMTYLE